jgi:hypothetical protein
MLPAETDDAVDGAANGVGVAQLQNDAIMAKKKYKQKKSS